MIAALPTNPAERAKIGIQLRDALYSVYGKEAVNAAAEKVLPKFAEWPEPTAYKNRETGRIYKPHTPEEAEVVFSDTPRHVLIKGGEGGGKSVAGIIKTLGRIRRGMSGVAGSPDFCHFRRSLWPEMQRWIPWEQVIKKQRDRGDPSWEPYVPFTLVFLNGATLKCGGFDDPKKWRGPNINFVFCDEVALKKTADVIKVFDGRVRIPGPDNEPPQLFAATTPELHWLHTFYGPLLVRCDECGEQQEIAIQEGAPLVCEMCGSHNLTVEDELEAFKHQSRVITLLTIGNAENLADDFAALRRMSLTESEARVFLEAQWEDIRTGQPFLPSMLWWDACKEDLPELGEKEPMVLVVDAATGREVGQSDCFALLGMTRHPDPERRKTDVAIRYTHLWQAPSGGKIDFQGSERNPGPEREIRRLCQEFNVVCLTADPRDLHDMLARFRRERVVYVKEFGQVKQRNEADSDWLRVIQERRVAHDGNKELRQHVANTDRKTDDYGKHLRCVKRRDVLKIDLCVCASMGSYTTLRLNM